MSDQLRNKSGRAGVTLSHACMFFAVITSIFAFVAWFVFQIQNIHTEEKINKISTEQEQLVDRNKMLIQYESNLEKIVGLEDGESLNLETINELKEEHVESYEGIDQFEGSIEDLAQLLSLEVQRLAKKHRKHEMMAAEVDRKLSIQKSRLEMYKNIYSNKQDNLTSLKKTLSQRREIIEQDINNVQDQTTQTLSSLDNKIEQEESSHEKVIQELELKRSGVETNISELKQKQKAKFIQVKDTDGKILRTETKGRWAHINIGKRDRVKAGMEFGVYSSSNDDERIYVGTIKVKQVFSDYARCKIISEESPTRPVLQDYVVSNPFFSIEGPKQIAIIGSFPNQNKLKNSIEAAGSTVKEEITPELDFAITGSNYQNSEKFDQARNLGILLSKFEHFRRFTD